MFSKKSLTAILVTVLVAASCSYGEKPSARLGSQTTDVEEIERTLSHKGSRGSKYNSYTCPYSCGDKYPDFLNYLAWKLYLPIGFPHSCCFWSALYKKRPARPAPKPSELFGTADSFELEEADAADEDAVIAMIAQADDEGNPEEKISAALDEMVNEMDNDPNALDRDPEVQKLFYPIKGCVHNYYGKLYKQMQCIFNAIHYPIIRYKVIPACYCHYRSNLGCTVDDCGKTYKLDLYYSKYPFQMCGQCTHGKYHPGFPNVESWNKCTGYCHMAYSYYAPQLPQPTQPTQP